MLEQFYKDNKERHVKTISRTLKFNKDLAEDIVQQAYLQALQFSDSFDVNRGSFNTWFNKILFNVLKTYQRDFSNTVSLDEGIEVNEDSIEYLIILDRELSAMDNPKHRKVADMFYRNGYHIKEIMQAEKISSSNVKTICNRFKNQLKEKYRLDIE